MIKSGSVLAMGVAFVLAVSGSAFAQVVAVLERRAGPEPVRHPAAQPVEVRAR
jgi:hypothetical protein